MKVSVVIPVYNEEGYIEKCLVSIFAQRELPDEVIVVDNNCTDKTVEIVKKFPGVRIVKEKMQGMTPARNKGFNSAKYDIIARTDADTIVPPNWIKRIKIAFNDLSLQAYSGPARFQNIPKIIQAKNWQTRVIFKPFKVAFGHDCLFGPNMALRKSIWEKVKNEVCLEDTIVHEDMDLAFHVGKYGKIRYDPKHIVLTSSRRLKKLYSLTMEYGYRNFRTLQHHKRSLHGIKVGTQMVGKLLPRPRKIMKRLRTSLKTTLHSL